MTSLASTAATAAMGALACAGDTGYRQEDKTHSPDRDRNRLRRYADMASVAGVGVALLAALFLILDHQHKAFSDIVKAEVAPLAAAMGEMDKRLTSRIDDVEKVLTVKIDGLGGRMDQMDKRMDQLDKRMDQLDKRMDRFEHRMERFEDRAGNAAGARRAER